MSDEEIAGLGPNERALVASAVAGVIDRNLTQNYDPDMAAQSAGETDAETFRYVGVEWLELMIRHAGLAPGHAVLDIGCGGGRMAYALAMYLNERGSYFGFDPNDRTIAYAQGQIRRPNFRIEHVDLHHRFYRPQGTIDSRTYRFPCGDGSIDIALAASILTHMELDVARHYLRETCRVLKPGGHAVFSIFGLTAEMIAPAGGVTALHGKGGENSPYAYRFKDHGDGFYGHCDVEGNPKSHHLAGDLVGDPVAYDIDAFGRHCREAGFTVASVLLGGWCRPEYLHGYQDMFVLRKPGGTTPPGGVADAALAPDGSAASPPASDPRLRDLRKLIRFLESRLAEETDARKRSVREAGSLRKQLAAGRRALDRLMEHVVRLRRNPLTRPFARSALLDEVRQVKQTLAPPPARPETNERRSDAT